MSDEIELKPCPFCGSDDITFTFEGMMCRNCGAMGPDPDDLIGPDQKWNTRHV